MRKVSKIMSLLTVGLITFAVAGCSDGSDEGRAAELVKYTERSFLNPISQEMALDVIQNNKVVYLEVIFPDGLVKEVPFELLAPANYPFGRDSLKPATETEVWYPNSASQFRLYKDYVVFPSLENNYGIVLTANEREALQMPNEMPNKLSRYGTVDLLIAQEEGTFYNGPVTLIWDDSSGSFKLIYSQESGMETELPTVNQK